MPLLPCRPARRARRDSDRFPELRRWRGELAAAEKALADLLPATAKVVLVEPRRMRDRANDLLLGMYAQVAQDHGAHDRRFRIEHAQHLRPQDIGLPGSAAIPVRAVMADQQAGMFGQACFTPGSTKNTFGTAGVLTGNAGSHPVIPEGLTGSVGWTVGGQTAYEVEGVVFHSGQTMQWLRDRLGVLSPDDDIESVASRVPDTGGVYVVPAFAGMCAPHWVRDAQAAIVGLTLESSAAHVVRAGVEAMAYQTRDNVTALVESGTPIDELKVDGGAARSGLLCQFQADILGIPVVRPTELERTALGVAQVAGIGAGLWSMSDLSSQWQLDRVFEPTMSADRREELHAGWQEAVRRTLAKAP